MRRLTTTYLVLGLLAFAAAVLPACATNPATGKREFSLMSEAQEIQLGKEMDPQVRQEMGVYEDAALQRYVSTIGMQLARASERPNLPWQFTVVDEPAVNAFALPGGYIYVTRGILALASDTSELAAVLAHEIAHVVLKHARARTNRVRTNEIVDKVVTGVFGGNVETDQSSNRAKMQLAAFSQQQELAADKEGIQISGKAGFDPHAAARFLGAMSRFAKFSAGDDSQGDDFLSSHPSTPDRIQKAIENARAAFGAPGLGETDRLGYMAGIEGIAFGDSPNQGAIVGQRYIQPSLKFTFTVPNNYTLQSSKGAVVGVAGDGEAVRFDSAVVPKTMALTDYLKSGWIAGLQPATVKKESFNGIDMATGVAVTDQWNFRVAVARMGDQVFRFIFAAKFASPAFEKAAMDTLRSFRATTDKDLSLVRRLVIRTVVASNMDTADSLARRMNTLTRGTELFYILNNLYPGDPVQAGEKYKIVAVQ